MSSFLIVAIAVFFDRLLGKPTLYNPLRGFVKIATFIQQSWHGQEESIAKKGSQPNQIMSLIVKIKGLLAVLFLVLPFIVLTLFLDSISPFNFIGDVLVVYLTIGANSLKQQALDVQNSLAENNMAQAQKRLEPLVSQDTASMGAQSILVACVEAVLKNGNDAILAPIFWFLLLGAPGAVLYKLINTLAMLWNYQNDRYRNFGLAANRFNEVLSFFPACLTALSYLLLGDMKSGWQCLLKQGRAWPSANSGPVIAAGAGALHITISGDIYYAGQTKKRLILGIGQQPQLSDIARTCSLIERSMILWLAMFFILSLSHC